MLRCVHSAVVASMQVRCVCMLCVHIVYTLRGAHMTRWVCGGRYVCSLRYVYTVRHVHSAQAEEHVGAELCLLIHREVNIHAVSMSVCVRLTRGVGCACCPGAAGRAWPRKGRGGSLCHPNHWGLGLPSQL